MSSEWRDFVRPRRYGTQRPTIWHCHQAGMQFDYSLVSIRGIRPRPCSRQRRSLVPAWSCSRSCRRYYRDGHPIAERKEIMEIAAEVGRDDARFAPAFDAALETLDRHYEESAALLTKLKGQGSPTLALQQGATPHRFCLAKYLGKPNQYRKDCGRAARHT